MGCDLADQLAEDIENANDDTANVSDPPFYVGNYDGSVDYTNYETGVEDDDTGATGYVKYDADSDEVRGNWGTTRRFPDNRCRFRECNPRTSSLDCEYQDENTLYETSLSFSSSGADLVCNIYRQKSDGDYVRISSVVGSFSKE